MLRAKLLELYNYWKAALSLSERPRAHEKVACKLSA